MHLISRGLNNFHPTRCFEPAPLISYNADMRIQPRFSLRTLLVAIALLSIPMGWLAYQLSWIRQRHEFLQRPIAIVWNGPVRIADCPWSLALFGERASNIVFTPRSTSDEARQLFPEATIEIVPD
jgi:hypothetical protein